ncbi:MAG: S-layer homology domain-containing protein [Clostridia bacterium]|nr:S-layer homology domain-containing protein [Clostridia bacterium]
MKYTYKLLLCAVFAAAVMSLCAFAIEAPAVATTETINTIKLLEIANGDENGNMNYSKTVTRAEFVKMAVSASVNKEKAKNNSVSYSLFPDVKNTFWGAGYISTAIESGLVNGYLDGTFRPNNDVTLEEGVTIVLRLLGYTTSDFKGSYPASQLEKYTELELDKNISAVKGDKLTREECMILLYNLLNTKNKSGSVYCTVLGCSADSNGNIDYAALIEDKLDGPFTSLSQVAFSANSNTEYFLNNSSCAKEHIKEGDVLYFSDKINSVFAYRKTATGIVASYTPNGTVTLVGSKSYTAETANAKNKLAIGGKFNGEKAFVTLILGLNDAVIDVTDGDISKIGDNADNASLISMIDATISTPIYLSDTSSLMSWQSKLPFSIDVATFYINGSLVSSYSPLIYDVLYYSKPFNSLWIYRKTESGTINSITTSSITLASKSHSIATDTAKLKVSTYGEYKVDDYVTVILGKNDEVIDILDGNITEIGKSDNDSSYSEIVSTSLKGPYIITSDGKADNLTIELEKSQIYYLNELITASDIQPYDVYYFSPILKTVWIYRDSASGTIESITPAAAPTSVTMSGKAYSIESSQASYDLSSFGSFGIGDKATFLLGMDGKVAGVVSVDVISKIYYGVVTDRGSKEFTEKDGKAYTADYVTVTDLNCNSYTYEHSKRNLGIGDIVRVSVGETVKITEQSSDIGRSGIASVVNALNNKKFADDCKIIEIYGSTVKKVFTSRFDGASFGIDSFLYSSSILYYNLDDEGNLSELILDNFTGDLLEYGIVTSSASGQITYMTSSTKKTAVVSGLGCSEGAAVIYSDNGAVSSFKNLTGYVENLDFITKKAVYDTKDKEYLLSENVKIFHCYANSYKLLTLEEAIAGNYEYVAYYDKTPENAGRIRVIIATNA